jgi:long-chain fatty acid transport protein
VSGIVVWIAAAFAGGFEVAPQGASTGGLAHAGTALTDRAESAWFNPAALADGGGLRVGLGATFALSRVRATSLPDAADGPWEATSVTPVGVPPWLAVSHGQAWWAVSAWAGAPFAGGVRWPEGWAQRFDSLASQPRFFRVGAAFSGTAGPVSLSAGVHVDTGSLRIERATDHVVDEGRVTLLLRGTGVGGDASVLVRAGKHATVGLSYKSRTALPLAGEADFDLPPAFAATRPDQEVSSRWTLPDRLALGLAWTEERWLLTLDATLTLWSVNQSLPLDFADPATPDAEQVNGWRDTGSLRLGVEGEPHRLVALRAGVAVDGLPGAPPPASLLGPSSPDATRLSATAGIGVQAHPVVSIDGWVEPLMLLRRASTSPDLPQAAYQGWAIAGGVGLTLRTPRKGPSVWDTTPDRAAP